MKLFRIVAFGVWQKTNCQERVSYKQFGIYKPNTEKKNQKQPKHSTFKFVDKTTTDITKLVTSTPFHRYYIYIQVMYFHNTPVLPSACVLACGL